jgi:hypothetical protein
MSKTARRNLLIVSVSLAAVAEGIRIYAGLRSGGGWVVPVAAVGGLLLGGLIVVVVAVWGRKYEERKKSQAETRDHAR